MARYSRSIGGKTRSYYSGSLVIIRRTLAESSITVSLNKKLVTYHLARLKDKNAAVRLKSIHELAELGDPEALDTLQEMYRSDTDLEVRKAAQAAGRAIFIKNQQQ